MFFINSADITPFQKDKQNNIKSNNKIWSWIISVNIVTKYLGENI